MSSIVIIPRYGSAVFLDEIGLGDPNIGDFQSTTNAVATTVIDKNMLTLDNLELFSFDSTVHAYSIHDVSVHLISGSGDPLGNLTGLVQIVGPNVTFAWNMLTIAITEPDYGIYTSDLEDVFDFIPDVKAGANIVYEVSGAVNTGIITLSHDRPHDIPLQIYISKNDGSEFEIGDLTFHGGSMSWIIIS